jgi:hypothetical protein
MSATEILTLIIASAAFGIALGCALQLRRRMRDRVDIWVHQHSLPGTPPAAPVAPRITPIEEANP